MCQHTAGHTCVRTLPSPTTSLDDVRPGRGGRGGGGCAGSRLSAAGRHGEQLRGRRHMRVLACSLLPGIPRDRAGVWRGAAAAQPLPQSTGVDSLVSNIAAKHPPAFFCGMLSWVVLSSTWYFMSSRHVSFCQIQLKLISRFQSQLDLREDTQIQRYLSYYSYFK